MMKTFLIEYQDMQIKLYSYRLFLLLSLSCLVLASCKKMDKGQSKLCCTAEGAIDIQDFFSSTNLDTLSFEVDYMDGQEPEVGNALDGNPAWNFFQNNIGALLNDSKSIVVPKTLEEMQNIPGQNQNYSAQNILAIANQYRQSNVASNTLNLYIVFLDGYFLSDGQENTNVLGVSIENSGVIALFKPVIDNHTFGGSNIKRFTEQTVLIHEAGHALGLVNNGLSLQSDHQDEEHGAHCNNSDCVMYWANEGLQDVIQFMMIHGTSTQAIVFGNQCLADAHAHIP